MARELLGLALALLGCAVLITAAVISLRGRKRSTRASPPTRAPLSAPASGLQPQAPTGPAEAAAPATSYAPFGPPTAWQGPTDVPALHDGDEDDMTLITLRSHVERSGAPPAEDDDDDDDGVNAATLAHPILFDEEAGADEPTGPVALFLLSAAAQTDTGKVRKRNEDSFLVRDEAGLYVVADGMGGYAGGDVASQLAAQTVEQAFAHAAFGPARWPGLPRRAWELAGAIDAANTAVFAKAREEPRLAGMGTTLVAARFSAKKQRLYLGHVGDSRCYRLRGGKLTAMTEDHTLASVGVGGPAGNKLVRGIGIQRHVEIDLVLAKPHPGDVYLLCTDGLTKMVGEEEIAAFLRSERDLGRAAQALVQLAIDHGGKDNVTVVLVRVERAFGP